MKRSRNQIAECDIKQYYKIGDQVEAIRTDIGAWFHADIIDILPNSICKCNRKCTCVYRLLFEGDKEGITVDRSLDEIRQITWETYHHWDVLKPGMKVVINYNVDNPGSWGFWYDYIINKILESDSAIFLKGTLLIGYNGCMGKISMGIDSDNVADILAIKPHATLEEKEQEDFATGLKPEYCERCKNRPLKKCKTCACSLCGLKKDYMITLQCDECCKWFHTYCLEPPLMEMPEEDDWYCPNCNNEVQRIKNENKSKIKSNKVSKEMGPKRKYIRRNFKEKKNEHEENNQKIRAGFLLSESTEIEEITPRISKIHYMWNEIRKLYPNHDIEGLYVSIREKKIVPDKNNNDDDEFDLPLKVELSISDDVHNKHLWDEAKEYLSKGKKAFLDQVKTRFTCSICCELMKDPITLSCKHNFCISCFFKSLSMNVYNCALCRTDIALTEHYSVNEKLQTALSLLFSM